MSIPSSIYLYRIIHIRNLEYILRTGKLTCMNHPEADTSYIGIGDDTLKESRKGKKIALKPFGTFSDYVAFYFGYRSPMLYNIVNGYQGVQKRSQQEIIYLVTAYDKIKELDLEYVFFDGHGYHSLSELYNTELGFSSIDWNLVKSKRWNDTEADPDCKRRKQAEFLIYQSLPIDAILGIGVLNEQAKQNVNSCLEKVNIKDIRVLLKPDYYYL